MQNIKKLHAKKTGLFDSEKKVKYGVCIELDSNGGLIKNYGKKN